MSKLFTSRPRNKSTPPSTSPNFLEKTQSSSNSLADRYLQASGTDLDRSDSNFHSQIDSSPNMMKKEAKNVKKLQNIGLIHFKIHDIHPRQQRYYLGSLKKLREKLRQQGIVPEERDRPRKVLRKGNIALSPFLFKLV